MPKFTTIIPEEERGLITLPPPPWYNERTGEWVAYATTDPARYADIAMRKSEMTVYVDEELDVFNHPGSLTHFRMMVRCCPWREDLRLIMRAAQHMQLVQSWNMTYRAVEGVDERYVKGYWDIEYTSGRTSVCIDDDSIGNIDVYVPYGKRRRIWGEMFEALGYTVRWGSSIINVRKRR